jgi:large subunit ribosomal protein L22
MVGWRAAGGARAVLRRLSAAAEAAAKQDGRVFAASYSGSSGGVNAPFGLGQYANLLRAQAFASRGVALNFHQLIRNAGISTTRNLLAADDAMVPVSSPLTPPLGDGEQTDKKGAIVKRLKVQAIKKDIKQVKNNEILTIFPPKVITYAVTSNESLNVQCVMPLLH